MTIQTFIEKAIEGGWIADVGVTEPTWQGRFEFMRAVLDPIAWQAVGRVEGWCADVGRNNDGTCTGCSWPHCPGDWRVRMHDMIDALANGKTIEEFLATL